MSDRNDYKDTGSHERRYQWIINVLLVTLGFSTGMLFEAERMKSQVVTNTVEIRILKDSLSDIQDKLTMLIGERNVHD